MASANDLEELHALEQELHAYTVQKESLRAQLAEVESATAELASAKSAYRIVGTIMVEAKPEQLTEELARRKQDITKRIAAFEQQEKRLREKFEGAQARIVKGGSDE